MNYKEYVSRCAQILEDDEEGQTFQDLLPQMLSYAYNRIYREIDFLNYHASATTTLAANDRNVTLPANINVVESANVITPDTATNPDLGTRNPLDRLSLEAMNFMWPTAAATSGTPSMPLYYALLTDTAVKVAPAPSAAYTIEFIGTTKPIPLTADIDEDFISINVPDLLIAASVVYGAGYQRDYGMQSDDPKLAMSWEQQYQTLFKGIDMENLRKKARRPA